MQEMADWGCVVIGVLEWHDDGEALQVIADVQCCQNSQHAGQPQGCVACGVVGSTRGACEIGACQLSVGGQECGWQ